jgi:hypothetical protein
MPVTHDWECAAHGHFEARGSEAKKPRCPKGCSSAFVSLVYLQPVGHVSARTKNADRLLKDVTTRQKLSDLSTSPSRPGDSVMDRLRRRNQPTVSPAQLPGWGQMPALGQIQGVTNTQQMLSAIGKPPKGESVAELTGIGHTYKADEWKTREDGKVVHNGGERISDFKPPASVERVKEKIT